MTQNDSTRTIDPQYAALLAKHEQARAQTRAAAAPVTPAHPVILTRLSLPFGDVFRLVLLVMLAQVLLLGILGAGAALLWSVLR